MTRLIPWQPKKTHGSSTSNPHIGYNTNTACSLQQVVFFMFIFMFIILPVDHAVGIYSQSQSPVQWPVLLLPHTEFPSHRCGNRYPPYVRKYTAVAGCSAPTSQCPADIGRICLSQYLIQFLQHDFFHIISEFHSIINLLVACVYIISWFR